MGETVAQFSRFVIVGIINTAINFIVLNILSYLTHIDRGAHIIYFSVIAFAVATTNSYYMNKHFTFRDPSTNDFGSEFTRFLAVSVVGAAINSSTLYLITTHIHPLDGISSKLWLNLANAVGIAIALIWNFFGYRKFVFKDR